MPLVQDLGMKIVRRHKDGLTMSCPLGPHLMNGNGTLHGGVTATIADTVVGYSITAHTGIREITTTELKINYLRPIVGKKATARAKLIRVGQQLCVAQAEVFDEKRNLAAVALITYMFLRKNAGAPNQPRAGE